MCIWYLQMIFFLFFSRTFRRTGLRRRTSCRSWRCRSPTIPRQPAGRRSASEERRRRPLARLGEFSAVVARRRTASRHQPPSARRQRRTTIPESRVARSGRHRILAEKCGKLANYLFQTTYFVMMRDQNKLLSFLLFLFCRTKKHELS